jgi:hypothetical protein
MATSWSLVLVVLGPLKRLVLRKTSGELQEMASRTTTTEPSRPPVCLSGDTEGADRITLTEHGRRCFRGGIGRELRIILTYSIFQST